MERVELLVSRGKKEVFFLLFGGFVLPLRSLSGDWPLSWGRVGGRKARRKFFERLWNTYMKRRVPGGVIPPGAPESTNKKGGRGSPRPAGHYTTESLILAQDER